MQEQTEVNVMGLWGGGEHQQGLLRHCKRLALAGHAPNSRPKFFSKAQPSPGPATPTLPKDPLPGNGPGGNASVGFPQHPAPGSGDTAALTLPPAPLCGTAE